MAPLTGSIAKLAFGGKMAGGDEWSISMIMAATTNDPAMLATADGFKAPLTDWFGREDSHIHPRATLEYVKFNLISRTTGKYTEDGVARNSVFSPVVLAPAGALDVPNQLTSVITTHSVLARGRGSKGRFYPPSTCMAGGGPSMLSTDGRLYAANAKDMADSAQELLSEINAVTAVFTLVVFSRIANQAHPIERVSVGRVVDTQRRRRSSLAEDRQFATANV